MAHILIHSQIMFRILTRSLHSLIIESKKIAGPFKKGYRSQISQRCRRTFEKKKSELFLLDVCIYTPSAIHGSFAFFLTMQICLADTLFLFLFYRN